MTETSTGTIATSLSPEDRAELEQHPFGSPQWHVTRLEQHIRSIERRMTTAAGAYLAQLTHARDRALAHQHASLPNRRVGARFCSGCPSLLALVRQSSGVVHEHRIDPNTGAVAERHVCRPLLNRAAL